jgi:hypothetical protein
MNALNNQNKCKTKHKKEIEIDHTHDEHLRTSIKQLETIGNQNNPNSISSAPLIISSSPVSSAHSN